MPYLYTFTPEIVRSLQSIELARAEVRLTILPPALAESLRLRARVRSTHFSTRIEGKRLTIHPFYDGNGRTARLLVPWILYRGGYDLGRFYALEEFYAQDLQGYYDALVTHPHHNYMRAARLQILLPGWHTY